MRPETVTVIPSLSLTPRPQIPMGLRIRPGALVPEPDEIGMALSGPVGTERGCAQKQ
jgi:hypothetical protein